MKLKYFSRSTEYTFHNWQSCNLIFFISKSRGLSDSMIHSKLWSHKTCLTIFPRTLVRWRHTERWARTMSRTNFLISTELLQLAVRIVFFHYTKIKIKISSKYIRYSYYMYVYYNCFETNCKRIVVFLTYTVGTYNKISEYKHKRKKYPKTF